MGLFGKNKKSSDELLDLSFFYKGEWDAMTRFLQMCDYSKMKPDNSFHALLLSGKDRYLSSKQFTRKELYATLVSMDMFTRSLLESPQVPAGHKVFMQELKLTMQHIEKELKVETFVADGKNIAIRDAATKKLIDL